MRAFGRLFLLPLLVAVPALSACTPATPARPVAPTVVTLRGHHFSVELATTPEAQAHGLMDRTSMPADHGMLFVFEGQQPRTFWMKNTLIPLDMLFFDGSGRLVSIVHDAQPCKADPCPVYPSNAPARYVLELNAGTADAIGARRGDAIGLPEALSGTQ